MCLNNKTKYRIGPLFFKVSIMKLSPFTFCVHKVVARENVAGKIVIYRKNGFLKIMKIELWYTGTAGLQASENGLEKCIGTLYFNLT